MYHRSYQNPKMIPPNYSGNAFDTPKEEEKPCQKEIDTENKLSFITKEEEFSECKEKRELKTDDLILLGLILLLISGRQDDKLLLMLVLLFVCGI